MDGRPFSATETLSDQGDNHDHALADDAQPREINNSNRPAALAYTPDGQVIDTGIPTGRFGRGGGGGQRFGGNGRGGNARGGNHGGNGRGGNHGGNGHGGNARGAGRGKGGGNNAIERGNRAPKSTPRADVDGNR